MLPALGHVAGFAQFIAAVVYPEVVGSRIVEIVAGNTGNPPQFQLYSHGRQNVEGYEGSLPTGRRILLEDGMGASKVALHGAETGVLGNETVVTNDAVIGGPVSLDFKAMVGNNLGARSTQENNAGGKGHEQYDKKGSFSHTSPCGPLGAAGPSLVRRHT